MPRVTVPWGVGAMGKFRPLFSNRLIEEEHEPLRGESSQDDEAPINPPGDPPFSWVAYFVFLLLGVSMLWAWNMFLVAASYFMERFSSDEWILSYFQPSIVSVANVTNLATMLILANLQLKASYPKRVISALVINIVIFSFLALSTAYFLGIAASAYFGFVLTMVFSTSVAAGLLQNGGFALASGFGMPAYTQAIMTGQAIAGVLPSIVQIIFVLVLSPWRSDTEDEDNSMAPPSKHPVLNSPQHSSTAMVFFLTATALSILSLLAFLLLGQKHRSTGYSSMKTSERMQRKAVGLLTLFKKLFWLCASVFLCFAITMFFPIFTTQITSNTPTGQASRLFQPDAFIPLAFLFWNTGDLLGRLATLHPSFLIHRPVLLFVMALCRIGFLPLYLLCNINGRGAVVPSDAFYLIIVQLGFGLTNGWLGSSCMMETGKWVEEGEREATGGFMVLVLVAGLTIGSFLSFAAA